MKTKTIDFKILKGDSTSVDMKLIFDKEKPMIGYNGQTYLGKKPGELFEDAHIKNPKPLPKNTYGFSVEDNVIIVTNSKFNGLEIHILNPGLAVTYKGKNRTETILKITFGILAIIILVLIATMGW